MQRRPKVRRPRPANRRPAMKIAAGGLVLGLGVAAIGLDVASHGSAPVAAGPASVAAKPASYSQSGPTEWALLNAAISGWGPATGTSLSDLASVSQQSYAQARRHGKTLDVQRGIVVFAAPRFLILRSRNGATHLWVLSGATRYDNVANSTSGSTALTANATVSQQAVTDGDMVPAVNLMAGGTSAAANLLTANRRPQTITVHVAGTDLTVTVTITQNTATMSQTATLPASGAPAADPVTMTMSAWSAAGPTANLVRGDLAMLVGTRSHGLLQARIVLYTPLTARDLGGANPVQTATPMPTSTTSHW